MTDIPTNIDIDPAGPIVADAVVALVDTRHGQTVGDALAAVRALNDIIAAATAQLPETIDDARRQHYSWDAIANALGISRPAAVRRYNRHERRTLLAD
jgi:hypothetical protein